MSFKELSHGHNERIPISGLRFGPTYTLSCCFLLSMPGMSRANSAFTLSWAALFLKTKKQKAIAALREIGVQKTGVSHCTGFDASMRLAREFGENFFVNNAGSVYVLDDDELSGE